MQTKTIRYIILAATAICFIITVVRSWQYTIDNGGTDLRCRTVGSRLLTDSKDPYFYKWNPNDGDRLLDPNDPPGRIINGNVMTPATLWLLAPLASLDYPVIRISWFFIQYLAIAGLFFFLINGNNNKSVVIPLAIVTLGILCAQSWLMHTERGQIYIVYTLLFGLIYWLYNRSASSAMFLSGFTGGLFIFFRPFALVLGAGILLTGNRRWIYGAITGILTAALLFVAPRPQAWQQYFTAMQEYQQIEQGNASDIPDAVIQQLPLTIEGTTNITQYAPFSAYNLLPFHIYASQLHLPYSTAIANSVYLMLFVTASALFYLRNRKNAFSTDQLFLFGFLLYFIAECTVIAPRGPYNLVQWIFPLFLIIRNRVSEKPFMILIIAALLLLQGSFFSHPLLAAAGELMLGAALLYTTFGREPLNEPVVSLVKIA